MFILSSKVKVVNEYGIEVSGVITHIDAKRTQGAPVIYHVAVDGKSKTAIKATLDQLIEVKELVETPEQVAARLQLDAQRLLDEAKDVIRLEKEKVAAEKAAAKRVAAVRKVAEEEAAKAELAAKEALVKKFTEQENK